MNDYNILIVEDEQDICEILKFNLENEGYNVEYVLSAEQALKKDLLAYNLILLDVMMEQISGFEFADKLKKKSEYSRIPIIFITAKDKENDMLTGFSLGADDYIQKPFSIKEVSARVKAVLRRSNENGSVDKVIKINTMIVDFSRKKLEIDEKLIDLTHKEYKILELLIKNQGVSFTRDQILNIVWKDRAFYFLIVLSPSATQSHPQIYHIRI